MEAGAATFWAIAVTVRDGAAGTGGNAPRNATKVDYKEVLSAPDFTVFSALRELRKSVAQAEGVAVYTVFTNEQLAAMVTGKVTSLVGLRAIDGIGEARAEKYGSRFLERLRASFSPTGEGA